MNDLIKYLKEYGNLSYKEYKFNEIDALIYSAISYIDYRGIKVPFTIKEAYYLIKNINTRDKFINKCLELLKILSLYPRYNDNIITNYEWIITSETQFGGLSIKTKNFKFIAYTGTTDELVGWHEDFKLSYSYPIKAQEYALKFLNKSITPADTFVYIAGHSKGGNLAMYSYVNTNYINRIKIINVFNFDGPGFLTERINSHKFKRLNKKLINYYPEESVVGMILNTNGNKKIIKSINSKVMQHDLFSWNIKDNNFCEGKLSKYSINFNKRLNTITNKYDSDSRRIIIDTFFNILDKSQIKYKSEINILNINKIITIIKETVNLSNEEKDMFIDIFKILFTA